MKIKALFSVLILLSAFSCVDNSMFFSYETIPANGWHKDSALIYDVPVADSLGQYNVYVNIRNRGEYPHQNLWLFLEITSPDSVVTNDTIEFYLADHRGKWLGSGVGSVFEMPVLYQQKLRLPQTGTFRYKIIQGMRDTLLVGINDVGLRVEKVQ